MAHEQEINGSLFKMVTDSCIRSHIPFVISRDSSTFPFQTVDDLSQVLAHVSAFNGKAEIALCGLSGVLNAHVNSPSANGAKAVQPAQMWVGNIVGLIGAIRSCLKLEAKISFRAFPQLEPWPPTLATETSREERARAFELSGNRLLNRSFADRYS
jgi:hypothetical protein